MKVILFALFSLGVCTYTLHQESQLSKIEYNKYHLSIQD
jgi:hypothetical protein